MDLSYALFSMLGVVIAFIYTALPIPEASIFSFDAMVLLFLVGCFLNSKSPPTLFFAWCLGLMQDVFLGSALGEHAFALTLTAYMILALLRRMQFFALWQQVMCVGCLTLVNQLLIAVIEGAQGHFLSMFVFVSPVIMNMALWVMIGYAFFRHKSITLD